LPALSKAGSLKAKLMSTDQSVSHDSNLDAATRIDPRLLEILVCPVTKGMLHYDARCQELISPGAKLAYPIRDGIPIMLPEEARKLEA
jgi:uncharacterized protein